MQQNLPRVPCAKCNILNVMIKSDSDKLLPAIGLKMFCKVSPHFTFRENVFYNIEAEVPSLFSHQENDQLSNVFSLKLLTNPNCNLMIHEALRCLGHMSIHIENFAQITPQSSCKS